MRSLHTFELGLVSGGTKKCAPPPPHCPPAKKAKGNNGFGNGGQDGSNAGFQDSTR